MLACHPPHQRCSAFYAGARASQERRLHPARFCKAIRFLVLFSAGKSTPYYNHGLSFGTTPDP
jgi:hypothetical protein